jgi:hypothetical protein
MNCVRHPEVSSEAFCTQCGRALCRDCTRMVSSSVYCEDCLAASLRSAAPDSEGGKHNRIPSVAGGSPEAAFVLGLIPGVGAIYNGEYFKAAIHVLIFGMLTSIGGLLAVAFYFYMPFEAYYTARKSKFSAEGIHLETPMDRFYEQFGEYTGGIENKELWGGMGLVLLGVLYLLDSFNILSFHGIVRLWPVALIAVGAVMLVRSRRRNT